MATRSKGIGRGNHPNSIKAAKENAVKNGFVPGQSGNPEGRPSGSKNYQTVISEIMELSFNLSEILKKGKSGKESNAANTLLHKALTKHYGRPPTRKEFMILKQIHKAASGDTTAFQALADREEGRPTQKVTGTLTTYEQFLDDIKE